MVGGGGGGGERRERSPLWHDHRTRAFASTSAVERPSSLCSSRSASACTFVPLAPQAVVVGEDLQLLGRDHVARDFLRVLR